MSPSVDRRITKTGVDAIRVNPCIGVIPQRLTLLDRVPIFNEQTVPGCKDTEDGCHIFDTFLGSLGPACPSPYSRVIPRKGVGSVCYIRAVAGDSAKTGSAISSRAPPSGRLLADTVPPCARITASTNASPNPCPLE